MRDSNAELRLNTEAANDLLEYDNDFIKETEQSMVSIKSIQLLQTPKAKKKIAVYSIDIAHLSKKSISLKKATKPGSLGAGIVSSRNVSSAIGDR